MTPTQLHHASRNLCRQQQKPTQIGALLQESIADLKRLKPMSEQVQKALQEAGGSELVQAVSGVGLKGGSLALEFDDPATAMYWRYRAEARLLAALPGVTQIRFVAAREGGGQ